MRKKEQKNLCFSRDCPICLNLSKKRLLTAALQQGKLGRKNYLFMLFCKGVMSSFEALNDEAFIENR